MNFYEALESVKDQVVYLYSDFDILDINNREVVLNLSTDKIDVKILINKSNLKEILGLLSYSLQTSTIISWKIKNIKSYIFKNINSLFMLNNIYDLSVLESYSGIYNKKPNNFKEAVLRFKSLSKLPNWNNNLKIHKNIFLNLFDTLTVIESVGVVHKTKKTRLFSYYEIDGQINGRLKSVNVYKNTFNPHNTPPEENEFIIPYGFDTCFLGFDYNAMEVYVLAHLSQDKELNSIIQSGEDVYSLIWEKITSKPCNPVFRQKTKDLFLPVIYGLSYNSLSEKLKIPIEFAKLLINKISSVFSSCNDWIIQQQNQFANKFVQDCFGRIRTFEESYKIRNFSIQSPASLICLNKLNKLHEAINDFAKITMHIHDGYVITCNKLDLNKTIKICKDVLEAEETLIPGLKLKTSHKFGFSLKEIKER